MVSGIRRPDPDMNDNQHGTALVSAAQTTLRYDIASWVLMGLGLLYVLQTGLLAALLGGLLVYELVHLLAPRIATARLSGSRARAVVVALLGIVVVGLFTTAVLGLVAYVRYGGNEFSLLLHKLVAIIDAYRTHAPAWLVAHLPADADALKQVVVDWLRDHAGALQLAGTRVGRTVGHLLIGMIIGAMIALQEAVPSHHNRPLTRALKARASTLATSFRRVVFAQVRIAALNTVFTWLYLAVALPLFGVHLPFTKTLVLITFVAGLLPVLGNLISNTIIVIVSLNQSPSVALSSLIYLVLIHKLEYFLNARIIGSRIRTRAWEILLAMIALEVLFGIPGIIAAPIYYAYIKDELRSRYLV